jgi:hypothetical protein
LIFFSASQVHHKIHWREVIDFESAPHLFPDVADAGQSRRLELSITT